MATAHKEVIIMLFSFFIQGFCEDVYQETKAGIEYMQIFRNIPTLFEYFLDVLEKRVEVLERNDLAPFQVNDNDCENSKVKREAESDSVVNRNIPSIDKQEEEALEDEYTTKIFDNGRANGPNTNLAKEDTSDNTVVMKRENIKTEFKDKPHTRLANMKNPSKKKQEKNDSNKRVNRNSADFGNGFPGVDWAQFYLAPEEVEEKAIKTEQMIEEHNSKNRRK